MDKGTREGFPDMEIVCGVLRIIEPGNFKDMLINEDDLSVERQIAPNYFRNECVPDSMKMRCRVKAMGPLHI